jgi:polyribonucleotide nucleotidyltransferase
MSYPTPKEVKITLQDKTITIQTGKLANLADGAVTVRSGDTVVLVTAVSAPKPKDGVDFFPLTVEYREKASAVGKFPGGYFKREGRPSEKEILTCRMTDRPLRPLFPKGYFCDTQIISTLLSADGENDPDVLTILGASAALCISDIPFNGPIGAVRVGRINGQFIVNPTHSQRDLSDIDLVYAGTTSEILMFEGEAHEISEQDFLAAMQFAQQHVTSLIQAQNELASISGKTKRTPQLLLVKEDLLEIAYQVAADRIEDSLYRPSKIERQNAVDSLRQEVEKAILEKYPEATSFEINQAFDYLQKKAFRKSIFERKQRCDGRAFNELRPLLSEVAVLPRVHGSALFARGETKALTIATIGSLSEVQELDGYTGGDTEKRFILHYNFPPFSVGETGRVGTPGRREIGHGALAERSIAPMLPDETEFPYAIRVSSEIMESNGSTSMASVCAGSLCLMDAGVPLKAHVAGISVGLVTETDTNGKITRHQILTDIIGSEDHFGDMDCKIAGTRKGITGFQLDLKLPGVSFEIMREALEHAATARQKILDVMEATLRAPRSELAPTAPRIVTIKIHPEKIGALIGPGGKTIRAITAETGVEINVEDDGTVQIYSNNPAGLNRARSIIEGMAGEIEIGRTYEGRVVSTKEFGAFVELFPGRDGLVHISELAEVRVNKTEDVVKIGDVIRVKCIGVDEKNRVKLSRKAVLKEKTETSSQTQNAQK